MWNAFPPPGLGFALSQAALDPILCGSGVVSHDSPRPPPVGCAAWKATTTGLSSRVRLRCLRGGKYQPSARGPREHPTGQACGGWGQGGQHVGLGL